MKARDNVKKAGRPDAVAARRVRAPRRAKPPRLHPRRLLPRPASRREAPKPKLTQAAMEGKAGLADLSELAAFFAAKEEKDHPPPPVEPKQETPPSAEPKGPESAGETPATEAAVQHQRSGQMLKAQGERPGNWKWRNRRDHFPFRPVGAWIKNREFCWPHHFPGRCPGL